jgi:hypothetical protein
MQAVGIEGKDLFTESRRGINQHLPRMECMEGSMQLLIATVHRTRRS